jgi:hypothetical protein
MRNFLYLDPLHLCIALGPVAVYLLLLGVLNLASRPFLTSGARDTAALGLAISGFVVAGPMELFLPLLDAAVYLFGGYVWLLLLALYVMGLSLVVLLMRPRLVIYNIAGDQLRPILATAVAELDNTARWAGESLVLPQLGVQLHLEPFAAMRNIQLVASGPHQNFGGWRRLEQTLIVALRQTKTPPNPYGLSLILFGLMMVGMVTYAAVHNSHTLASSLWEMLRL